MTLHIDLQDGFQNDEVTIRVDGKQIYHKTGVTTDARISRADGVEAAVQAAEVTVEADVPTRHLKTTQKVTPGTTSYIGISVRDGKLDLRTQAEVFLYM